MLVKSARKRERYKRHHKQKVRVYIDVETRSRADIKKVGSYLYLNDPSTELLVICYAINNGPVRTLTGRQVKNGQGCGELQVLMNDANVEFVAHNAAFEIEALKRFCGHIGTVVIDRWKCTMAKACAHNIPAGLDKAGAALKLTVQKDKEGTKIMQRLSKPYRGVFIEPWDEPDAFTRLYLYCADDVRTTRLLDGRLRDLSNYERNMWRVDWYINNRGVRIDLPTVRKANAWIDRLDRTDGDAFRRITGLNPTQNVAFKKWLHEHGCSVSNCQGPTLRAVLASPIPKKIKRAIELYLSAGKTSLAKYRSMLNMSDELGYIRGMFFYHGARTGRWSGRGVQLQNLPRPSDFIPDPAKVAEHVRTLSFEAFQLLYGDVAEALSIAIRGMFIPSKGKKFVVCDFSQMEARVLSWLAGHEDELNLFRNDEDVYCYAATPIYGRIITEEMKTERQTGKVARLALGYQGAINAFAKMAKAYYVNLDAIFDTLWATATPDERERVMHNYIAYLKRKPKEPVSRRVGYVADLIKERWRKANAPIVLFWKQLEKAAVKAVQTKQPVDCGKLRFFMHDEWLHVRLPSGRFMRYHRPQVVKSGKSYKVKYKNYDPTTGGWGSMYGGKWAENFTQAVQNDMLRDAMLDAHDKGFYLVLHVHDEDVAEVDTNSNVLPMFEKFMKKKVKWAPGLPVNAKGWEGFRYGK